MKKAFLAVLIFVSAAALSVSLVLARAYPQPLGFVNDFADIISPSVEADLENRLSSLEASSSHELTVVTLDSLEGDTIENVAVELFEQWGIGKKNQDNGILFLIAPNDRQLRFEVGYGLEPILTDSRAGNIIRTIVTPQFKQNDYDAGITQGVEAVITVVLEDPTAFDYQASSGTSSTDDNLGFVMFVAVFLTVYITSFLSRSRRFWPGGVVGALAGFFAGIVFSFFWAVFIAILFALWGLFLDYLLSKNYKLRKSQGLSTSWWKSMGGFSSGSSSGSSFGGFGGGSSGGGGASGSW